jgi:2-oxoglutarate dehydrogenase complex dehydrogenase (E1) component-like enzyme
VVLGAMRARQEMMADRERVRGIPVLIHGDAAISGEGIVPETLALAQLPAYQSGGTLHLIVNNQIGFTTAPQDARATRTPRHHARGGRTRVPRQRRRPRGVRARHDAGARIPDAFKKDVCIDLLCYRKYGHNEMDDPSFTQPVMYRASRSTCGLARVRRPAGAIGRAGRAAVERIETEIDTNLRAAHRRASNEPIQPARHEPRGTWQGLAWAARIGAPTRARRADPGAGAARGHAPAERVPPAPQDHAADRRPPPHVPRGPRGLVARRGVRVRHAAARGPQRPPDGRTWPRHVHHRHAALFDAEDGRRWVPLQHLVPEQGRFEVVDSMLSEAAVLGSSTGTPRPTRTRCACGKPSSATSPTWPGRDRPVHALGRDQVGPHVGLTLLLPHGYEGQGPEHSSGRLERFLELCADRQHAGGATSPRPRSSSTRCAAAAPAVPQPLVIMSPKSLLRHKLAVSPVREFTDGRFQSVLDDTLADPRRARDPAERWAAPLRAARGARGPVATTSRWCGWKALPVPRRRAGAVFARLPATRSELCWVQEEPANMGGWRHLRHRIEAVVPRVTGCRRRAPQVRPSPATGFYATHQLQEAAILEAPLSAGPPSRRLPQRKWRVAHAECAGRAGQWRRGRSGAAPGGEHLRGDAGGVAQARRQHGCARTNRRHARDRQGSGRDRRRLGRRCCRTRESQGTW